MHIAPALAFISVQITQSDVHAAHISRNAVYHGNLAVVTIVHAACKPCKAHRHKAAHYYTGSRHFVVKTLLDRPATHVVVHETHLYTPPYRVDKAIAHQPPKRVVLENEILHVDIMLRAGDVTYKGRNLIEA